METFQDFVIRFLKIEKVASLWWMSDFYEEACKSLSLDFNNIQYNTNILRRKMRLLVKSGVIECRRTGTGMTGRADTGCTNMNTYTLPGFWDN